MADSSHPQQEPDVIPPREPQVSGGQVEDDPFMIVFDRPKPLADMFVPPSARSVANMRRERRVIE